jgi:phage-related minor tail protein
MRILGPVVDLISLIGSGLGDLMGSGLNGIISMFNGGSFIDGVDFTNSNKAGKRFEDNLGYEGYYNRLSGEGDGGNFMASGGIVKGPTRAIIGEAGPEAVIPLSGNTPALKVDNSETNNLLKIIANKLTTVDMYEVQ